jgi:hypothetical protein
MTYASHAVHRGLVRSHLPPLLPHPPLTFHLLPAYVLSPVCCLLSPVSCLLSAACCLPPAVCCLLFASLLSAVCCLLSITVL